MIGLIFVCISLITPTFAAPWPSVETTVNTSLGTGKKDVALVVSIEDYAFVADIQGAQQNGRDWYRWLISSQKIPSSRVVLLENKQATREAILLKANELSKLVKTGGTFWFVFIGHGAPSRNGKEGLLLGMDVDQTATSIYARGLGQKKLFQTMKQGRGNVLAIVDACFSGTTSSGTPLVENLQPLIVATARPTQRNVTLLTAASSNQFAGPLAKAKRPAFSYLLLGAFRGWGDSDNNGLVSAQEALDYSRNAISTTIVDRSQTPQASGKGLDRNYSRAVESGPDLVALRLGKSRLKRNKRSARRNKPAQEKAINAKPQKKPKNKRIMTPARPKLPAMKKETLQALGLATLATTSVAFLLRGSSMEADLKDRVSTGLVTDSEQASEISAANTMYSMGYVGLAASTGLGLKIYMKNKNTSLQSNALGLSWSGDW